jgi:uncharacterized membrane protein
MGIYFLNLYFWSYITKIENYNKKIKITAPNARNIAHNVNRNKINEGKQSQKDQNVKVENEIRFALAFVRECLFCIV